MNSNYNTDVVLLSEVFRKLNCKIGNKNELRELYFDVKRLEKLIVLSGKDGIGKEKCRMNYNDDIERLMINILLRWRTIKFGV